MMDNLNQKVKADHLKRKAYLYIRQSTLRQVFENTESTKRQYALYDRAIALGWVPENIIVIDSDLGQSGAQSAKREGFKRLVSEVGLGNAGIVLGLEVSRLARNSSDWHRLLEICALTKTLILDEDGIYDPGHFNDRLLLGLKGTMSEAELHIIKARLQGGIDAKARRGELQCPIPIGFMYDDSGKIILDPNKQIQQSIHLLFEIFHQTGSATATVKYFRNKKLEFPHKIRKGPFKNEVVWTNLRHHRVLHILHNPRYAGAFCFGRIKTSKLIDGTTKYHKLPQTEWPIILKNNHVSYISWEKYEENQNILKANSQAHGIDRRKSPPREGPALLQGIVICGICGNRMTVRYHSQNGELIPEYMCQKEGIQNGEKICQNIKGNGIDKEMEQLLLQSVNPYNLEIAIQVQQELRNRLIEADTLRKKQVERARYEADLARRRYMQVDPENRLVASSLEADWNEKLAYLKQSQEEYEQQSKKDQLTLNTEEKNKLMTLSTDFTEIWNNAHTPLREKKRMVRLLIEDVTLLKNTEITMHVRFKGGAVKSLTIPAPMTCGQLRKTSQTVIAQIDQLLDKYTDEEVSHLLNQTDALSGTGKKFTPHIIGNIRRTYGLKGRYERLKENKFLTLGEIAKKLNVSTTTIKQWGCEKMILSYRYNSKNECLYEFNPPLLISKLKEGKKLGHRNKIIEFLSNRFKEVQYEI